MAISQLEAIKSLPPQISPCRKFHSHSSLIVMYTIPFTCLNGPFSCVSEHRVPGPEWGNANWVACCSIMHVFLPPVPGGGSLEGRGREVRRWGGVFSTAPHLSLFIIQSTCKRFMM